MTAQGAYTEGEAPDNNSDSGTCTNRNMTCWDLKQRVVPINQHHSVHAIARRDNKHTCRCIPCHMCNNLKARSPKSRLRGHCRSGRPACCTVCRFVPSLLPPATCSCLRITLAIQLNLGGGLAAHRTSLQARHAVTAEHMTTGDKCLLHISAETHTALPAAAQSLQLILLACGLLVQLSNCCRGLTKKSAAAAAVDAAKIMCELATTSNLWAKICCKPRQSGMTLPFQAFLQELKAVTTTCSSTPCT